jgi:hypothetical protein
VTDIIERLWAWYTPNEVITGDVQLYIDAAKEIERLRERLGPRGLEVVEINGAGHYVNEKVKDEIERLRKTLNDVLEEIRNSNIQPETILAARSLVGQETER